MNAYGGKRGPILIPAPHIVPGLRWRPISALSLALLFDKKHKKKRPRTSVPPEYASFYELMLPYYTELDSIASRAEAKQLIEHVWQKLEDGHSNGWIVVHDKPGDKTKWVNLFIKYAKCVLENP